MAEKVAKLNLQRDYKKFLYYIDGKDVVSCSKDGKKTKKVVAKNAVPTRDNNYLYFVDKEGDVSRSARATARAAAKTRAANV